ncbi:MAG TPA: flavin reductase [Solirubrobacteraceae bacterium]|nr:flavin reductase [Solirubrobacteraceae bacterium]
MAESPITAAVFRDVVGAFASGVTVITTEREAKRYGMTASAFSSVSLDPPLVLVCINQSATTEAAVAGSGVFAVNILGEDQAPLASHFARAGSDKFAGVPTETGELGCPLLADALGTLECKVEQAVAGGTHSVFMGMVMSARTRAGEPLTYFRGDFGQFQLARDHPLTHAVRERLFNGSDPIGATLDPQRLSLELGTSMGEIQRALGSLFAEGLVGRDARGRLVLPQISEETLEEIFDARMAVELGAAELVCGKLRGADLAALRTEMEKAEAFIVDGHLKDIVGYAHANSRFHTTLVGLAGSRPLLDAYRQLSLPGILVRGLPAIAESEDRVPMANVDHRDIVEAYERGDLDDARAAIRRHTAHSKESHRRHAASSRRPLLG